MPPVNLLSRYRLSSATPNPAPVPDRLFPWLALSDPSGLPEGRSRAPGQPFQVFLDTGFDGTLLLAPVLAVRAVPSLPLAPAGPPRRFGRARGALEVVPYALDLWGYEHDHGPAPTAGTGPRFLARAFVVWVSRPAVPGDPVPDHPPLLGMAGLKRIEADLRVDFRTGLCDLIAEGSAPPVVV